MKKGIMSCLFILSLFGIFTLVSTGAFAQIKVVCPGQSLQTAINSASNGQTITVSGTCVENVNINKNFITIDGAGTGAIQGPVLTSASATAITVMGENNTIKRLNISGGYAGVVVATGNHTLVGNVFSGSSRFGILVVEGANARIMGNTIQNQPEHGIVVQDNAAAKIGFSHGWDVTPTANVIQSNGGSGIVVTKNSAARIVGNSILNNTGSGILVSKVAHADISDNDISGNKVDGITVMGNSGVNLGADTGTDIFTVPNTTNAKNKNGGAGISCSLGAYMDGRKGTLTGKKGVIAVATGCINDLK